MINALLQKALIPFIAGMILSAASILGIVHYTQKKIELSCPPPEITTQEVKCPAQQSAFEVEKMKGFKGTIEIKQYYTIESGVDSVMIKRMLEQMKEQSEKVKWRKRKKD